MKYRVKWNEQQIAQGLDQQKGLWVFSQGKKRYFAGKPYDGDAPEVPLERGWLEEVDG